MNKSECTIIPLVDYFEVAILSLPRFIVRADFWGGGRGDLLVTISYWSVFLLELDAVIKSKMVRVDTTTGMMWSCVDCGYVAKKANIIEHIDAKGFHNLYLI